MKRILLFFSALMLSISALWAHDVEIDGIYYNLDETNKTAEVTYGSDRYNSPAHDYAGSITIPETITYNAKTYSVTSIGPSAFGGCSELTEVTIPNSVTVIYGSFIGCSGLTSITIPKSVTDVVLGSFSDCTNLKTLIWNAINGRTGGEYEFSQVSTVIIGNEVQSIPPYLFCAMKIKEVTIPNSVTSIGDGAFKDCSNLTSITIPESVTYIGDNLFKGCSGLKSVVWNAKNCADFIFDTSNYYEHAHIYPPFYDSSSSITSFIFGNEVEHIPAYLCYGMSKLSEVTIPNSVTSIGKEAFYNCSGLTKVNYLGTVDKWVEFDWDNSNNNPTYYAKDLYINNELLTDVKITTADSIKKYAFYNCKSIKPVEIGNSVTSIDDEAFYNCSGLTSVTIPNSVTSIGSNAFNNCSGLTKVNYLGTVDKWVEFDWDNSNNNPTYYAKDLYINNELLTDVKITEADSIKNYALYNCQSIKSVEIGESVTYIGHNTFYGCNGLTSVIWNARKFLGDADERGYFYTSNNFEESPITSFTIGEGVERIPDFLCSYLKNLTEIIIPSSVTSIGIGAFYRSSLTSLTIPNSVTSIDSYAFDGCENLTKVNYLGTVDKWVEFDWDNSNNNPTYYAKDLYINNELLTEVKITTADSIKKYAFYNCKSIKSVEIGNSITSIHTGAFYGCENLKKLYNTSDLNITKGSTEYGYIAYYADLVYVYKEDNFALDKNYIILDYLGDYNQTTIELPAITKGINPHILSKFTNLTSITIGSDVANLNSDVFCDCNNLKEINVSTENPNYYSENGVLFSKDKTELIKYPIAKSDVSYNIPNTVTSIGSQAFAGCSGLSSITIPKNVSYMGNSAFYGCYGIKSIEWNAVSCSDLIAAPFAQSPVENITFGNEVQRIPAYLCSGMSGLDEITIPNTVTTIGAYAFSDCSSFTSVIVPNKVSLIAEGAFNNCSKLTNIILGQNVSMIENYAFTGCRKIREVTSYAEVVPETGYEEIFENYNANLYVPCDALEDYYYDVTFGSFKDNSQCMSAEEVQTGDKVEIEVDDRNNATVTWPSNKNAKKYNLVISKDGEVVCTLYFNRDGRLNSIDFKRSASAEQEGFKFTVTGLEGASRYGYLMSALGEADNVIEEHIGDFTTNGAVDIIETLADANITISNGLITCPETDFAIYNTIGQDVTAFNGSLQPGVYLVSIENDIVKVMIK